MENLSFASLADILARSGKYVIPAKGRSMYPMLRSYRDPVLIRVPEGRLKRYDVAVYRSLEDSDTYIIHRVLKTLPDRYIIRGDNCSFKENVKDDRIVGVMKGFWRGKRFIPVDNPLYICYSRLWVAINPLVRLHHFLRLGASRLFHKVFSEDVHPFH